MAVNHTRAIPIAPQRLQHLSMLVYDKSLNELDSKQRLKILDLGLQAEQVELLTDVRFFLQEAHDIYNARFR